MNPALRVPLRREHLPVATGFVRATANACGADEQMEYALVLAVEEVFARICESASPGEDLQVEIRDGGYCMEVRLLFHAGGIEFGAFNLTAAPTAEGESLDDLGLYLAARFVDTFRLSFQDKNTVALTLIKERLYPEVSRDASAGQPAPETAFAVVRAGPEEVKRLAELAAVRFAPESLPDFLLRPGKAIDMLQAGAMEAALAMTPRGVIGGGIFWRPDGRKPVEMIGPYVLPESQRPAVVDALVEECFRRTARTQAVGVFCRLTPEVFGARHFEILGETVQRLAGERRMRHAYYYRHLVEDAGGVMQCHPSLEAFLRRECDRLVLPREIRKVKDWGERTAERSLVACDFNASASVTMRGLVAGRDAAQNVAAHLARFEQERIRNVWFEMDLGEAWQASFAPALESAGMKPAVLIPNAATGDLLVFQKAEQ